MHVVCFNFVDKRSLHTALVLTFNLIRMVLFIALVYDSLLLCWISPYCTGSTGSTKLLFSARIFIWQGLRHY